MELNSHNNKPRGEDGFLLLGVLFLMLLLLLAMSIAAPKIAESIRRDKEVETVHRGMQYAHAIQVFYAKTGRYPTSIDQLMKTNNQRFLRKRYLDPMTGKDDWRLIHQGEAKVPALGLFGQAAQGGITPTGANTSGGSGFGSPATGAGGSSSLGSSGTGFGGSGSSFGSSGAGGSTGTGFGGTGSSFGSSGSGGAAGSAFGSPGSTTGGTDGNTSGGSATGTTGFGSSPTIGGPTTTGSTSGSAFGSPGATFGGAPIVGVGLLSKNTSIKIYKKQTHYNQWEFVFDPNQNTLQGTAGAATNLNGASNSTGVNGTSGFGSGNGSPGGTGGFGSGNGSGFGSNNGVGGSPASPVNPNSPGTSQ